MTARTPPIATLVAFAAACGPGPTTHPHDMSAAEHEVEAQTEIAESLVHEAQYQAAVDDRALNLCTTTSSQICWSDWENETAYHLDWAELHMDLASKHRAASRALLEAEATACAGVDEADRDMSPFGHAADIRRIVELTQPATAENEGPERIGATVELDAVPGLTEQRLQGIVNCHLARNAAVGHDMPEMAYCPLGPRGVRARVRPIRDGMAVDIRGDDAAAAAEIWRRAQRLTTR